MIEQISNSYPDEAFVIADGFDDAIIGVDEQSMRIIYSVKKMLEKLQADGMDYNEAREHYSFNIQGAYVGEGTPIYCEDCYL